MNLHEPRYTRYSLAAEMLQTPQVMANFDFQQGKEAEQAIRKTRKVFFTGEGSSRIFPAKHFLYQCRCNGYDLQAATEGSRQAMEYALKDHVVFGASNSGRTRELVTLLRGLKRKKHPALFSVCAFADTPLAQASQTGYVLSCGKEEAVAATKSVIEQALFYHAILDRLCGTGQLAKKAAQLSKKAQAALTLPINARLVDKLAKANILHWAGRNTGVAEELTLKTNEITRKRSAFFEGTYAVHGVEEVMSKIDAVIVIEPFAEEEEKFEQVLVKGVGCTVIALASRPTRFPTIEIPALKGLDCYLRLMAGWNLLVEIGCALGVNMDKTVRARKVGNAL